MDTLQNLQGLIMQCHGIALPVFFKEGGTFKKYLQVRLERFAHELRYRLGPDILTKVYCIGVIAVTTITLGPCHHRVMLKLIEPSTHKAIAALDLVVQEAEGQVAVHGLHPQGQAA